MSKEYDIPEWNVFIENFNRRRIEIFNIFKHISFKEDCDAAWKSYKNNFEEFAKDVKRSLMYYYWSKCEWEIVLSDFPPSALFNKEKVDVYKQVTINWDRFIDYLWRYYKERMPRE